MNKPKIVYDQVGYDLFIGLYGPLDFIEQEYNLAYNFEVTNGKLHWLNTQEGFAYFGTSKEALNNGYTSIFVEKLRSEAGIITPSTSLIKEAAKLAKDFLIKLPREHFIATLRSKSNLLI